MPCRRIAGQRGAESVSLQMLGLAWESVFLQMLGFALGALPLGRADPGAARRAGATAGRMARCRASFSCALQEKEFYSEVAGVGEEDSAELGGGGGAAGGGAGGGGAPEPQPRRPLYREGGWRVGARRGGARRGGQV